ncbi:MAG TPA: hypothetical protein DIU15_16415 [Deltaproteobacteria bacterium]|nr:hypothetical protein [Deltaproteobacteria bacterium]
MFLVDVGYPDETEEIAIVDRTTTAVSTLLEAKVTPDEILQLQDHCRSVPAGPEVVKLAVDLVRATRPSEEARSFVQDWVAWGAGPRASQFLVLGGKARALLNGRTAVSREDIRALAIPVLAHRVLLNFRAEAEGVRPADLIERLLDELDPPSVL